MFPHGNIRDAKCAPSFEAPFAPKIDTLVPHVSSRLHLYVRCRLKRMFLPLEARRAARAFIAPPTGMHNIVAVVRGGTDKLVVALVKLDGRSAHVDRFSGIVM
ncbi:hypothetical protein DPSP01_001699 [Paraphaeosphaeria sporulosa]